MPSCQPDHTFAIRSDSEPFSAALVSFFVLLLTVIQGPDKGRRFELPDDQPQLIGRSSEALALTDNTVSRRHAELTPDNGRWWVRDLASQNGTYVNGVRITDRVRLSEGDQVRTGSTVILFGKEDEDESTFIHLVRQDQIDLQIERTLTSNEDSVLLAEPEPRAAAMEHLRIIYELTRLTSQAFSQRDLLEKVMDLIFNEFKPERGFIMLTSVLSDEPLKPAVVRYAHGGPGSGEPIKVSRTILQHTLRKSEGVLSTNAMADSRFAAGDSVQRLHIRSAICSPVRAGDRVFGLIYIDSTLANYTFTEEQLALVNAIGQHAGLALANAELYAEKLQAERLAATGETVASLSHSIKNILQGLRGGADVVEMGLKKGDIKVALSGWDIFQRNLDRIVSLTMNMLAFSRPRRPEPELAQITAIIEECAQLLESQCAARSIALIIDADPEMPPIPLDPSLMHQAIMNLLTNAVEAVPDRTGHVTVRVTFHPAGSRGENSPPVASISIIDNGPGIPEHMQQRIFQPFTTTKGTRGTGLGLTVTKRIVEEHRGVLRVESAPAQGATFHILLPADPGKAIDPAATTPAAPSSFGFELEPPF